MSKITLDDATLKPLTELTHPVEICNATGRVVGKFIPTIDWAEWEPVDPNEPEVTDEELERLAASN